MTKLDSQVFIDELDNQGFDPQPYSGRAMFGAQCVSIVVESDSDLWRLAYQLGQDAIEGVPAPRTDSMGRDIVAYWPSMEWPE